MSGPLEPRIDFSGPLDMEQDTVLKTQQMFSEAEAQTFSPTKVDEPLKDDGQAGAVIDAALRPKHSLWHEMMVGGLALFGISVAAQGAQWTMNAWQAQDWVALGGCAAGALIVGAGVGSMATEWHRLQRLHQRAYERDEVRGLLHSHGAGKGRAFCEKLTQQAGVGQPRPALRC